MILIFDSLIFECHWRCFWDCCFFESIFRIHYFLFLCLLCLLTIFSRVWSIFVLAFLFVMLLFVSLKLLRLRKFVRSWKCFVFNYQSFSFNVLSSKVIWMSFIWLWISLKCRNCCNSFVINKNFEILTINVKISRSLIKFVSRLFVHIFFRSSLNLRHFNNVCWIVCFL